MSFRAPSNYEMWGYVQGHLDAVGARCGWVKIEKHTPNQSDPRGAEWNITGPVGSTTVRLGIGLGKRQGAEQIHKLGLRGMKEVLPAVLCVAGAGDAAGAVLSCAKATLVRRREPAMPAVTYFANMGSLPDQN